MMMRVMTIEHSTICSDDPDLQQRLKLARFAYQQLQYEGPDLRLTEQPKSVQIGLRPVWAMALAVVLVAVVWLTQLEQTNSWEPEHELGLKPNLYQVLQMARSEIGGQAAWSETDHADSGMSSFRLPNRPQRNSGFMQTEDV